jgi:molybdopterin converting factor small subunit
LIQVYVRLHGDLRELLDTGGSRALMSLPDGSSLEMLNEKLGVPFKDVVVTLVNGVAMSTSAVLQDGDRVDVFTPLSGG